MIFLRQVVLMLAALAAKGALAAPSATGPLAFVHEAMAESAPAQVMRALFLPFAPDQEEEEGEVEGEVEGEAPDQLAYGHDEEEAAGGGLGHLGVLAPLLGATARVRETFAHAHNLVVSLPKRIATFVGLAQEDEEEPEEETYGENFFVLEINDAELQIKIYLERSMAPREINFITQIFFCLWISHMINAFSNWLSTHSNL